MLTVVVWNYLLLLRTLRDNSGTQQGTETHPSAETATVKIRKETACLGTMMRANKEHGTPDLNITIGLNYRVRDGKLNLKKL